MAEKGISTRRNKVAKTSSGPIPRSFLIRSCKVKQLSAENEFLFQQDMDIKRREFKRMVSKTEKDTRSVLFLKEFNCFHYNSLICFTPCPCLCCLRGVIFRVYLKKPKGLRWQPLWCIKPEGLSYRPELSFCFYFRHYRNV
jgi:hypothetical protein